VRSNTVAPDGSPVEIYRRLPAGEEPAIIHLAAGEGVEILELGSGAGRVARALVALGHRVTAVDESADMLADLRGTPGVEVVQSRIEELDPGRTFPVSWAATSSTRSGRCSIQSWHRAAA
jgi:SAM-dependent methyltransferase